MKETPKFKKVVGYGYTGLWQSGKPGWWMPDFINNSDTRRRPSRKFKERELDTSIGVNNRLYLCKITVQIVKDKRGRPIIRKPYRAKEKK